MADVAWLDREWFAERLELVAGQLAGLADAAEGREPAAVEEHIEAARQSVFDALKVLGVVR